MTSIAHPMPAPFTADDYAARMTRVVHDAVAVGLDGVLVTPGPDLVWLAGYRRPRSPNASRFWCCARIVYRPWWFPRSSGLMPNPRRVRLRCRSSNGPMAPIRIRWPVHYWTLQADTASPT